MTFQDTFKEGFTPSLIKAETCAFRRHWNASKVSHGFPKSVAVKNKIKDLREKRCDQNKNLIKQVSTLNVYIAWKITLALLYAKTVAGLNSCSLDIFKTIHLICKWFPQNVLQKCFCHPLKMICTGSQTGHQTSYWNNKNICRKSLKLLHSFQREILARINTFSPN